MTGQRVYPFIVNGQFWMKQAVHENVIAQGEILISVAEKLSCKKPQDQNANEQVCATMKHVRFHLVEAAEYAGNLHAHWFEAFWASDDEIYIEDDRIYKK